MVLREHRECSRITGAGVGETGAKVRLRLEDCSFAVDSRSKDGSGMNSELGSEKVCVWGRWSKRWWRGCMGLTAIPGRGRDWKESLIQAIPGLELGSGCWLDRGDQRGRSSRASGEKEAIPQGKQGLSNSSCTFS